MSELTVRKFAEIRKVLWDTQAEGPQDAYYVIRDPGRNITIIPPFHWGKEYPRTYGHFHDPPVPETYQVLYGEGAVLMQKPKEGGGVGEVKFLRAKTGEKIFCPKEFHGHMLINLGKTYLVALDDDDPGKSRHLYDEVSQKRGFAYYVVEEGGKPRLIPNPRYDLSGVAGDYA